MGLIAGGYRIIAPRVNMASYPLKYLWLPNPELFAKFPAQQMTRICDIRLKKRHIVNLPQA